MTGLGRSGLLSATCALLVAALVLLAAGCGGGDGSSTTASGCEDVEAPAPRDDGGQTAPTEPLDASQSWTLTFDTSCGTFVVTLDLDSAPKTAASLVSLARAGYYDDTIFHRIVPGFVIQGGDPTQSGNGGPGYTTVDPPPAGAAYTKGVVAMAKTGAVAPGTAGSQFFVVTAADAGLPPDFALLGRVSTGMDVVDKIGMLGDPATELPTTKVVIEKATVSES